MRHRQVLVAIAGVVAAAAAASEAGVSIETRTLSTPDGREVVADFGRFTVPENRRRDDSREIELAFVRVRGPDDAERAPLVFLSGGPGGSSTHLASIPRALASYAAILDVCDLVFFDQRGTGASTPNLAWRPPIDVDLAGAFTDAAAMLGGIETMCRLSREHWESEGVDLDGYTTEQSADDLEDLRRALGAPRISLMGHSYGTHLGLATIRRHGGVIEAAVLAGVEGPDHTHKLPSTYDTQWEKLSVLAAADARIASHVPDLGALLDRLLERLEREPMVVDVRHPLTRAPLEVPVGRFGLLWLLRRDIGDGNDIPVFPRLLWSVDRGDPSILAWFVQKRLMQVGAGANAMAFVMDGASGASRARWARIEAESASSLWAPVVNFPWPEIDAVWDPPDLGAEYRGPIVSPVRTLFISGTLDSNTPPSQAEEVRWGFPNSTHIVVENAGHEDLFPHPEVRKAVVRFLKGEDVSDVRATLPPPRWVPIEGFDPEATHPSVPRP